MTRILFFMFLVLTLVSCSDDGDGGAGQASIGYDQNFTTPTTGLDIQNSVFDEPTPEELYSLVLCEENSTEDKLFKKEYSVTRNILSRTQLGPDSPIELTQSENKYETATEGRIYSETFSLLRFELGGSSVLFRGPYKHEKTCTENTSCGEDQLTYLEQDALYVARVESRWNQLKEDQNYDFGVRCRFQRDSEQTEKVTYELTDYNMPGNTLPAMIWTTQSFGTIYCEDVKIGDGTREVVEVIARDLLPEISWTHFFNHPEKPGCTRSVVFRGETLLLGDQVMSGSSEEHLQYQLDGELKDI